MAALSQLRHTANSKNERITSQHSKIENGAIYSHPRLTDISRHWAVNCQSMPPKNLFTIKKYAAINQPPPTKSFTMRKAHPSDITRE
ncbi:hypothetical protein [Moraxella equi]|uniref:hypothetical protein n=1 Tax=Moraxella equi TaxID=60442 RepID=UPI001E46D0D1|nr:hypothetical protein [Moraxella equi]